MATITNINRLGCALAGAAAALLLWLALPLSAKAADYDTTLSRLDELQTLAESYIAEQNNGADPMLLTLSYTRGGGYNDSIWQLTAGAKDSDFESYVRDRDESLGELVGMGSITLGNGDTVDFGHLLASINLVYNGVPITGSWGGDCMELARAYQGQASDAEGYASLMSASFNLPDDGSNSYFGSDDLRADLDSVNIGAELSADTRLADAIRSYYDGMTEYDRAYRFIANTFGTVNTGDKAFRERVYTTLTGDTGMQLLLYTEGMWTLEGGWQVSPDSETRPARRCLCLCRLPERRRQRRESHRRKRAGRPGHHGTERPGRSPSARWATTKPPAPRWKPGSRPPQAGPAARWVWVARWTKPPRACAQTLTRASLQLVLLIIGAGALLGLIVSLIGFVREKQR